MCLRVKPGLFCNSLVFSQISDPQKDFKQFKLVTTWKRFTLTEEFKGSWQRPAQLFITVQQKQFFKHTSGTAEIESFIRTHLSGKLLNRGFTARNVFESALQKTRLQIGPH